MDMTQPALIWAVAGLVLMLAELVIPGGIVVFLGLSGLLVAGAWTFGFIDSWVHAFTLWFISSLVLLTLFRNLGQKWVGGDAHVANTDELMDDYQQEATVVETIGPGQQQGRIEFHGSSWPAVADGSTIDVGQRVSIVSQDNLTYIVALVAPKSETESTS